MAPLPAALLQAGRASLAQQDLPVPHRGRPRRRRARDDRQGLGPGAAGAACRRHAQLRPGHRRRSGHRARHRAPARAAHLRRDRPGGPDRPPGHAHPSLHRRPGRHRRGGRGPARGDAGERDDRARRAPPRGHGHGDRHHRGERRLPPALRGRRGQAAGRTRRTGVLRRHVLRSKAHCPAFAAPGASAPRWVACGGRPTPRSGRCPSSSSPTWDAAEVERLSRELERRL